MSRTRIGSLVLVNWRGVFYERYLLDPNVTALEGSNGAGKTTVMIAAYVALLPDMSRLRFTNLGESGANSGDRGIWGRLGESGRPSYTALELHLAENTRIVAGVRLIKKGEPSVELTPFIIENLPESTTLQELLLVQDGDREHVPELGELRSAVQSCGAQLTVFRATKDYFAALFERGVSPLRLVGEEDRNKFNEMLRTSMTGGISRTLTSELRSFVLKRETGLGDTLSRMRGNLDACRRSRTEVVDARRLQREISGVYDAGTGFFVSLVLSVREYAEEKRRALVASKDNLAIVARGHADLASAVAGHQARQEQVQIRQQTARQQLQQVLAAKERWQRSSALRKELAERDDEVAALSAEVAEAELQMRGSDEERGVLRLSHESAQDAYDRAGSGLAELQDGLDELHRRARDYRQVHRCLDLVRQGLDRPQIEAANCSTLLAEIDDQCQQIDGERAQLARETQALDQRRSDYQRAYCALQAIAKALANVDSDARVDTAANPHSQARSLLAELERRSVLLDGLAGMKQEQEDLQAFVDRQTAIRKRAQELGLATGPGAADALAARLEKAERGWAKADEQVRHHQNVGADREREHAALLAEQPGLELRSVRFTRATEAAERIEGYSGGTCPRSAEGLSALDRTLVQEHAALVARCSEDDKRRDRLLQDAFDLDSSGGVLSQELLRVRDELSGELVAGRFEELSVAEAARLEATLGPLAHAIIVDDIDSAIATLATLPEMEQSVWLVQAGTPLETLANGHNSDTGAPPYVVVHETIGSRITPVPSNPTLGRSARSKAAQNARDLAAEISQGNEANLRQMHRLESLRRDVSLLGDSLEVYLAGDPAHLRSELEGRIQHVLNIVGAHQQERDNAQERAAGLRTEVESLRRLLGEAFFLEPPEYAEQAVALAQQIQNSEASRDLLASVTQDRKVLAECVDVLRSEPMDPAAVKKAQRRIAECETARDHLFAVRTALEEVLANRHALAWGDAEATLKEHSSLVPALQEQHKQARAAVKEVGLAIAKAEQAWTGATKIWQAADARLQASVAMRDRLAQELVELNPEELAGEAGNTDIESVTASVLTAEQRLVVLDRDLLSVVESGARDRERLSRSERRLQEAQSALQMEQTASEPADSVWTSLREACEEEDLLAQVLADIDNNSQNHSAEQRLGVARSKRGILLERLGQVTDGQELLNRIAALQVDRVDTPPGDTLAAWLALRDWMRKRVPAQIAEVNDPLVALERLREHLSVLESRLGHQEMDLRGSAEDVARGIDVQLRRARWQVHRLNEHLARISFGSIRGIRIQMSRVDRMEQILRALRDGQAQELLFQATLPFEEALNEIFARFGGGDKAGKTGGQRLLDYREYLHLGVEIKRQSGKDWEQASPTKLSTGEAIGVGAALMMVVLTEWERDANLLRTQKHGGSLRFLFLDEANRLSKDNLVVLFQLCRNLELQLLIAAPEVAHAGDNTTYRLVRRVLDNGGEEVLVSGRRGAPPEHQNAAADQTIPNTD